MYQILNFGCGPPFFRVDFFWSRLENSASFGYFEYFCFVDAPPSCPNLAQAWPGDSGISNTKRSLRSDMCSRFFCESSFEIEPILTTCRPFVSACSSPTRLISQWRFSIACQRLVEFERFLSTFFSERKHENWVFLTSCQNLVKCFRKLLFKNLIFCKDMTKTLIDNLKLFRCRPKFFP